MRESRSPAFPGCPVPMAERRGPARILAAIALAGLACAAPARAGSPEGYWFTEDRGGIVQVHPCDGALCGTIVGLREWPASGQLLDWDGKPRCHFTLLRQLRLQDDGRWHGTVTNPEDGRIYSAEVWVPEDGVLRLRGYVGLPLLGSTQHWPAAPGGARPDCHYLR